MSLAGWAPSTETGQQRDDPNGRYLPTSWFTNLQTKGNTGAASIDIMLDELFHSGRLRDGQRLLCMIPESGRFSMCYMLLTVVAAA